MMRRPPGVAQSGPLNNHFIQDIGAAFVSISPGGRPLLGGEIGGILALAAVAVSLVLWTWPRRAGRELETARVVRRTHASSSPR